MTPPAEAGTDQEAPASRQPATGVGAWRVVLESVGGLSIAAALLYSFGIAYARSYFDFYGIDVDVLALTTEQTLALSVAAAFEAVAAIVIVAVVAVFLAAAGASGLRGASPQVRARILTWIGVVAALLLAAGLALLGLGRGFDEAGPLALGVGAVVLEWALLRAAALPDAVRPRLAVALPGHRVLTVGVVAVAAFWFVTADAVERGTVNAQAFSTAAQFTPHGVRLYSTEQLRIQGRGVTFRDLGAEPGGESSYRYRYEGLVLLNYAADRWLLVPRGLQGAGGPVFVVPDRPDELRVDFTQR